MSKRTLWILTVALSLALAALIIVQINWAKNARALQEKQFQQLVNTTLSDVSADLYESYTADRIDTLILNRDLTEDVPGWVTDNINSDIAGIIMDDQALEAGDVLEIQGEDAQGKIVEILDDTTVLIRSRDNLPLDTMHISEYYEMEKQKNREASMRRQQLLLLSLLENMLLEDDDFQQHVDQTRIEKVLKKHFTDRGINLAYEYAVMRGGNAMVYFSEGFKKNTSSYYFRTQLMENRQEDQDTYLYVYFPGQEGYLVGSLGYLGISALVLTLVMVLLFSFALYVIFKQKKLSDVKNDFVNNMTHELKTPISTISLASQMLSDESIPLEKKNTGNISKIIQTESKRLGYQVERVLQMAVLDQGHLVLKEEEVMFSEIVTNVIHNFKLQVDNKQGRIEFLDECENDRVMGDKVHLTNVVTNLMDNAVKYCKEVPEISVKLFNADDRLIFSVSDNGIGISKENQKKVFERFFRVSTGNVHDVKGFGLGLSYVKLIVEEHGGEIRLTSELNKGTQFDIKLPYIYKTR